MTIETKLENARVRAEKKIDADAVNANVIYEWYGKPEYRSQHWNPSDLAKQVRNLNKEKPITKQHFTNHYDEYDHDFGLLADYIDAMYVKSNSHQSKSLMVIRKDDFNELISFISDLQSDNRMCSELPDDNFVEELENEIQGLEKEIRRLNNRIEELEGVDPLEQHLKSTAWNLNRIANVLEEKKQTSQSQIIKRLSKKGGF